MSLNPSMAGDFDVEYRFAANQRTQWRSVSDNPYSTYSISAESSKTFGLPAIGTGLYVMNDKAGDGQLNTLAINLALSYGLSLNSDSTTTLRLGTQLGYTQKNIDYESLRFDRQFNGDSYDATLSSQEDFPRNKVSHPNAHFGLQLAHRVNDRDSYIVGLSAYNLTSPNVAFVDEQKIALDQRFNVHAQYTKEVADSWDVLPSVQLMAQGRYREYLIGSRFRYIWRDDARALRRGYIGGFARLGDGAYLMLGLDYDAWKVGVSYDLNFSPLDVASSNRGGLELAVIYLLDIFNEKRKVHRACPAWL